MEVKADEHNALCAELHREVHGLEAGIAPEADLAVPGRHDDPAAGQRADPADLGVEGLRAPVLRYSKSDSPASGLVDFPPSEVAAVEGVESFVEPVGVVDGEEEGSRRSPLFKGCWPVDAAGTSFV